MKEILYLTHFQVQEQPVKWQKKIIGNTKKENIYNIWINEKINNIRIKLLKNDRNYDPCVACDVNGLLNGHEHAEAWKKIFTTKEIFK